MNRCPNEEAILAYAQKRGLRNAQLKYSNIAGWELSGKGRDENDWPLVWAICRELGISWGCGAENYHQCIPKNYTDGEENHET